MKEWWIFTSQYEGSSNHYGHGSLSEAQSFTRALNRILAYAKPWAARLMTDNEIHDLLLFGEEENLSMTVWQSEP